MVHIAMTANTPRDELDVEAIRNRADRDRGLAGRRDLTHHDQWCTEDRKTILKVLAAKDAEIARLSGVVDTAVDNAARDYARLSEEVERMRKVVEAATKYRNNYGNTFYHTEDCLRECTCGAEALKAALAALEQKP
jgi:sugar phosphate isomerase/epimerase